MKWAKEGAQIQVTRPPQWHGPKGLYSRHAATWTSLFTWDKQAQPLLHTLPTVAQRGWGVGDVVIKIPLTPGAESADQALTSAWWMRSSVLPSWRPRVIAPGQSANSAKHPLPISLLKHWPFVANWKVIIELMWQGFWSLRQWFNSTIHL